MTLRKDETNWFKEIHYPKVEIQQAESGDAGYILQFWQILPQGKNFYGSIFTNKEGEVCFRGMTKLITYGSGKESYHEAVSDVVTSILGET